MYFVNCRFVIHKMNLVCELDLQMNLDLQFTICNGFRAKPAAFRTILLNCPWQLMTSSKIKFIN